MKKHLLTIAIAGLAFCVCQNTFAQSASTQNVGPSGYNRCGSMEYLEWQKQQDPGLKARMDKIESDMQTWMKNSPPTTNAIVTIPIVVHMLYFNATQSVSATRVQQQVDVLNKDYHKLNTDWNKTPSAFLPLVADCEVQFCLASKDPSGAATTGIVYKQLASNISWASDNKVKSTAQGGDDPWDATKYLNLWVCNLGSGLLGYAQFPGGSTSTDGVVVLYSSLPGGSAPYNLGRTATHEIGHWLNLYHIWGDDGSSCSGTDYVADTPNQAGPNYGCKLNFPHTDACTPIYPGVMFMNYMDYGDDPCLVMFTNGQATRM